jgi:DNA-binding CsgD family transcriptional regulator
MSMSQRPPIPQPRSPAEACVLPRGPERPGRRISGQAPVGPPSWLLRRRSGHNTGAQAAAWSSCGPEAETASGETAARRDLTAPEKLTQQELQIALRVAEGRSNRDVAEALFLSPKTVEFHLTRVYRKLDVNSRAELIRLLAREGVGASIG